MDEKTLNAYRSFIHPLIALVIPFSFLLAVDGLLRAIVFSSLLPAAMPAFPVLLAAAGLSEVLAGNRLTAKKVAGFVSRLRELLLVVIAGYAVQAAAAGLFVSPVAALTNVGVIYGTFFLLAQWLLTYTFHRALRERELLYSLALGKRGAELKNLLREYFDEARSAAEGVQRVQRGMVIMLIAVLVLLAAGLLAGARIPAGLLALALGHEVLALLGYATLNQFLEEQEILGDGCLVPQQLRRRRFAALLGLFVVGALLALAATGRRSLFPASLLADLLDRIGEFLSRRLTYNYRPPPREDSGTPAEMDLGLPSTTLIALDQANASGSRIIRLIALGLAAAAGLLVLYFLVRPLLSREGRASLRDAHPLRFIAAKARAALAALREMGRAFVRWLRSPRRTVARVARTLFGGLQDAARQARESRIRADGVDRQRRQRLARVLREFLRIIRWGQQAGVPFRRSMGPLEYATALGGAVQGQRDPLLEAARAFEEMVFSNHDIGEQRVAEFYRKVEGIVRPGAGRR